jgi:hypothetical protein
LSSRRKNKIEKSTYADFFLFTSPQKCAKINATNNTKGVAV